VTRRKEKPERVTTTKTKENQRRKEKKAVKDEDCATKRERDSIGSYKNRRQLYPFFLSGCPSISASRIHYHLQEART